MPVDDIVRVLVVEDDYLVSQEIERVLLAVGYELVGSTGTGEQGIALAREHAPDVVLMDISLPRMDGLSAAQIIQEQCHIPVIVLSAYETEELVEKASQMGVVAYLTKPPDSRELHRAITIARRRHDDLLEIQRLYRELQAKTHELERFASVAAHDLQSPLQAIGFWVATIRRMAGSDDPQLAELFDSVNGQITRMGTLIKELLAYARSGGQEHYVESVDLDKLVGGIIEFIKPAQPDPAAAQEADIDVAPLPTVPGSRNHLSLVFQNLLSNAVKYTAEGVAPVVRVYAQDGGPAQPVQDADQSCTPDRVHGHELHRPTAERLHRHHWLFTVEDNGIGIPAEEQEMVFDAFTRSSRSSASSGTGLGLATCKQVIERHGGRIWIDDSYTDGTRFCFTLPKIAPA